MEVKLGLDSIDVSNDRVAGVVASSATSADVHLATQHIGQLSCKK